MQDSFGSLSVLKVDDRQYQIFRLNALAKQGWDISRLPYSLRILLENLLRKEDGVTVTADDIKTLATWDPKNPPQREIAFSPARTVLQDFTGVPAIVDLAAMRDAMAELGGDPTKINPLQPVELVIDHSIQVDDYGNPKALERNLEFDYQRNSERYAFLRWGQKAFNNFKVVPPNGGIVHQINLEYLSRVVFSTDENKAEANGQLPFAYPDTCVGTDSHTPMVNGLGILAWGVGGIEAEAAMLGQPISMLIPEVIGFKLEGSLPEGATATDLVLTITEILRKKNVVGKFVEFYGPGISSLSLADRATIGNMSPEYGATCAIFPPDELTLQYLRFTSRSEERISLVETYMKEQGLFLSDDAMEPIFTDTISLQLGTVEPSVAGPTRPQDRIALKNIKQGFLKALPNLKPTAKKSESGEKKVSIDSKMHIDDGKVVIAAITSCTNTSNPAVMMAAGLLAKKAVERGLVTKPWVKTSLAPGSKVVTRYYERSGLNRYLDQLGFNLTGYGCTTCIGNSGPLPEEIAQQIQDRGLVAASVLSGNRNFEGRINPDVRANFLMSPPLVVAFALKGQIDWDPINEPIGCGNNGQDIYLKDIWPTQKEINETVSSSIQSEMYQQTYSQIFDGDERWTAMETPAGNQYTWIDHSTYVRKPAYFQGISKEAATSAEDILNVRALVVLGDSVTTDHISPAGNIKKDSPAGHFLMDQGVDPKDFNSYGSRRGNHEVMVRGTFANTRLRNQLAPGTEGGYTTYFGDNTLTTIYEASARYKLDGISLCILAGKEYGSGSSRDWAAKGPYLLGIKFVIAESFERIHRSNLVGMGILPLQFSQSENIKSLELTGLENFDVIGLKEIIDSKFANGREVNVRAKNNKGEIKEFKAIIRIDTPQELMYYLNGGILHFVLRQLLSNGAQKTSIVGASQLPPGTKRPDSVVQEGSEESFPASDPPAY